MCSIMCKTSNQVNLPNLSVISVEFFNFTKVSVVILQFISFFASTPKLTMKLYGAHILHIVDEPLNAINVIQQRSTVNHFCNESLYICNISDILYKLETWKQFMPRVTPFYGGFQITFTFKLCLGHRVVKIFFNFNSRLQIARKVVRQTFINTGQQNQGFKSNH